MVFEQSGFLKTIGQENIFRNIDDALKRAGRFLKEQQG
jgi:hypothetical protein